MPKGTFSRAVNSGLSPRSALGRYVRASGGARTAARRAYAGRRTFTRAATFLGLVSRGGLTYAAREALALAQLVGQDIHTVLLDVASRLAPVGATNEDAVARSAVLATFDAFADTLAGQGIEALDHLDASAVESLLREYVTNYIAQRFLQELDLRIHRGRITVKDATAVFREVKDVIRATVAVDFRSVDVKTFDWESPGGRAMCEGIFREAYDLIEHL